ncbi:Ion transporter [Planctomycetales bacterium 10988]|nr:Ion transporter [Planctomycetales bacterium 10988]
MASDNQEPQESPDLLKQVVDFFDRLAIPLVWYSVLMLAIECHLYPGQTSYDSHPFFLWSERVVASLFTLEYLFRCLRNSGKGFYPFTVFGMIDLVSILPFWLGFIPAVRAELDLVRTLRVLRMLKFFRYSRGLQVMTLGFYRAFFHLKPLLLATSMIIFFTMFALYEVEGPHQEEFRSLFLIFWFLEVTGTTVGYGDFAPHTYFGKAIVMFYMVAGLAIFMACFSAITSSFEQVFEDANDPEFNPLDEFAKVSRKQSRLEELFRDTGTTDDEDAAAEEEHEGITF